MKETGRITRPMGSVNTSTTMAQNTVANELMISSKGTEKRPGLMELATRVTTLTDKRPVKESSPGTTAPSTKATSTKIRSTAGGYIHGPMEELSMDSGRRIRCMARERISGRTVGNTWVTM
jgi:hypothetical protein